MKKLNHPQQESLHNLLVFRRGVSPVSEWTSGSGKWTSRRTIPAFSEVISVADIETKLRGEIRKAARRLIKKRPRIQEIVAVTDLRAARRVLRENDWSLTNPFERRQK